MAKSTGLTIEQVREIVNDEELNREDLAEVLRECFGVELPGDMKGESLAEFIFATYQKKADEITSVRRESKLAKAPRKKNVEDPEGNVSRAAFIVGLIQQGGRTTRKELEAALDDAFHYTQAGKSPRTRINRVLRNLKAENKIALEGGAVTWIG